MKGALDDAVTRKTLKAQIDAGRTQQEIATALDLPGAADVRRWCLYHDLPAPRLVLVPHAEVKANASATTTAQMIVAYQETGSYARAAAELGVTKQIVREATQTEAPVSRAAMTSAGRTIKQVSADRRAHKRALLILAVSHLKSVGASLNDCYQLLLASQPAIKSIYNGGAP
jgi:hypothetical protein